MINNTKKLFFLFLIIGFIGLIIYGRIRVHKREANYLIIEGKVTEKGHRAKTDSYVAYTFLVDNIQYFGSVPIKFCNECEKPCCYIGAKIKVRYEKGNPNNNDLIH